MIDSRFKKWVAETLSIQNILGGKAPKIYQYSYDKYLSSNPEIKNRIKEIIKLGGLHLFVAAPGTGKTNIIMSVFKEEENTINILFVPNKAQALQIGTKFNVPSFVGGKDVLKHNFNKINNAVFVYDKANVKEFVEIIKKYGKNINVVVDETHNVVSSAGFRNEAISNIDKVKELVLKNGGTVIEMTASPQTIGFEAFDSINHFYPVKEYEAPTKEINVIVNKSQNKNFLDFTFKTIMIKGKGIVRYQSKDCGQALAWYLNNEEKKKAYYVNADTKEYYKVGELTKYKNEMFDGIINRETLPQGDYFIQTSINDAGINICDIEGGNRNELNTYFCLLDSSNVDLMNIEQFSNRLRFESNSMNILITDNSKKQPIESYINIIKRRYFELSKQIKYLNLKLDAISFKYDYKEENKDKIRKQFEAELEYRDIDDKTDSMGCIYLNDDFEVAFDKKLFFLDCWEEYNRQFYNNIEALVKELEMIFNRKINVINVNDVDNYDILNNFYQNCVNILDIGNKEEVGEIKNTKIYKDFVELTEKHQLSKEEALDLVLKDLKKDKKDIGAVDEVKNKEVKEELKNLKPSEINKVAMVLANRELMADEKFKAPKKEAKDILTSNYVDYIKKCVKMGYDVSALLNVIANSNTYSECDSFMMNMQYITINNKFKNGEDLESIAEKEQRIVVEQFFDKGGKARNIKLTKNKLDEINENLMKELNRSYSNNKILKLISRVCKVSEKNNTPTSLITKFDLSYNYGVEFDKIKKNTK